MKKYILAIDQGTTGSRAFLFDSQGKAVNSSYKEFKQYYPKPGWVEHDAEEIWKSCADVIKGVLRKTRVPAKKHRCDRHYQSEGNDGCLGPKDIKAVGQSDCLAMPADNGYL